MPHCPLITAWPSLSYSKMVWSLIFVIPVQNSSLLLLTYAHAVRKLLMIIGFDNNVIFKKDRVNLLDLMSQKHFYNFLAEEPISISKANSDVKRYCLHHPADTLESATSVFKYKYYKDLITLRVLRCLFTFMESN